MKYVLQVDFPYPGPWGDEMSAAMAGLAMSIAQEKGLIWKIWTSNQSRGEAGGIYLFESFEDATAYLAMHADRLQKSGISSINGKIFEANEELSKLNRGPI